MLANRVRMTKYEQWLDYRNIAPEGVATASGVRAHWTPDNAINGDTNTNNSDNRWVSDGSTTPWLQVDLLQEAMIDKVTIYSNTSWPIRGFEIQAKIKDKWVKVASVVENAPEKITREFKRTKTNKVRLQFDNQGHRGLQRVYEFEIYGKTKGGN